MKREWDVLDVLVTGPRDVEYNRDDRVVYKFVSVITG
jgi:hypothetical protein